MTSTKRRTTVTNVSTLKALETIATSINKAKNFPSKYSLASLHAERGVLDTNKLDEPFAA